MPNMEQETEASVSKVMAVIACLFMTLLYVAILYAPTLILRLPPPSSLKHYLIRRFICAVISSIVSLIFSAFILSRRSLEASNIFSVYGIRADHMFGPEVPVIVEFMDDKYEQWWRTFVRLYQKCAADIPCPFEPCNGNLQLSNVCLLKASMIVGLQLGLLWSCWYASFLFVRTGHLVAPLVAHMFCNYMGLPVLFAWKRAMRLVSVAFVAGVGAFIWLLFPITRPDLYNNRTYNCRCWHGYCSWN